MDHRTFSTLEWGSLRLAPTTAAVSKTSRHLFSCETRSGRFSRHVEKLSLTVLFIVNRSQSKFNRSYIVVLHFLSDSLARSQVPYMLRGGVFGMVSV